MLAVARCCRGLPFLGLALMVASAEETLEVYIGAGCFWHVQETVNHAEERVLKRAGGNLTGITGFAGGSENDAAICYNNYGDAGHTEVTTFTIPRESFRAMLQVIWPQLFPNGDRSDTVNRGPSYRSAVGFPGGSGAAELMQILEAIKGSAQLEPGNGDDADSLGTKKVFVYDSNLFPFHQAEVYHQFYDYGGPAYKNMLLETGRLRRVDCPSEFWLTLTHPVTLGIVFGLLGLFVCICACHCWLKRLQTRNGPRSGKLDGP